MADTKLTALTELTAPALDDWLYTVDKSDTTDDAAGSSRKVLASTLLQYMPHGLSEISVTGATTATIGRMHVCSGTTADYELALPAASGNTGKIIVVRMATGLTKLVTLNADGTEKIDNELTRKMWAGESAILLCDGSNWFKIGGKSIPMMAMLIRTSSQNLTSGGAFDKVLFDTAVIDVGSMANTASSRFDCRRSGNYIASGFIWVNGCPDTKYLVYQVQSYTSGNTLIDDLRIAQGQSSGGGNVSGVSGGASMVLSATNYVQFYGYSDSTTPAALNGTVSIQTHASLIEVPSW
jgi:hypothetical protein